MRLKGQAAGRQLMTVESLCDDETRARLVWFDADNKLQRETMSVEALEDVPQNNGSIYLCTYVSC